MRGGEKYNARRGLCPIPNGEVFPDGPSLSVGHALLASMCLRAEPQSVSAPRVTIVAACGFHLVLHSSRCQRERERSAELSATELRLREGLSGSVVEISYEPDEYCECHFHPNRGFQSRCQPRAQTGAGTVRMVSGPGRRPVSVFVGSVRRCIRPRRAKPNADRGERGYSSGSKTRRCG